MNDYEERQEARRERYEARADKAESVSDAEFEKSRKITEHIPFGQPILVGHHSEGRHRRDLDRSDRAMRRSCDARDKAEHYRRKAESVGKGGISSDDPDALTKLQDKIRKAEEAQGNMKAANKIIRSGKDVTARLIDLLNISESTALKIQEPDFCGRVGFPGYELTNNNANIRRMKKRIEELEQRANEPIAEDVQGEGYTISEERELNRLLFSFDTKPSREVCQLMRTCGFRWARTWGAWSRQLNNGARYKAKYAANIITRDKMLEGVGHDPKTS